MKRNTDVNGILVVDKPAGITSHDVVDRVRRLFRTKRVGHTGTLDPDATGVLVLCLGNATRLAEYLASAAKHYEAEFVFGVRTDTMDASGTVLSEQDASHITEQTVRELLPAFRGRIMQTPPMVSARHHEGRRLYELAREGVTVDREAREVFISQLEVSDFIPAAHPLVTLEVTCSTGTYIRVLADDMGAAAGTGAMMKSLRRTWVGVDAASAFTLAEAHTLDALERSARANVAGRAGTADLFESRTEELPVSHGGNSASKLEGSNGRSLQDFLVPLAAGLRAMPQYRLKEDALRRLRHGQCVSTGDVADIGSIDASEYRFDMPVGPASTEFIPNAADGAVPAEASSLAAILDEHGEVCAVVRCEAEMLRPVKVLAS